MKAAILMLLLAGCASSAGDELFKRERELGWFEPGVSYVLINSVWYPLSEAHLAPPTGVVTCQATDDGAMPLSGCRVLR